MSIKSCETCVHGFVETDGSESPACARCIRNQELQDKYELYTGENFTIPSGDDSETMAAVLLMKPNRMIATLGPAGDPEPCHEESKEYDWGVEECRVFVSRHREVEFIWEDYCGSEGETRAILYMSSHELKIHTSRMEALRLFWKDFWNAVRELKDKKQTWGK